MERLGRGVVALRSSSTQIHVSWRLLGNDPAGVAFNLYRAANGGTAIQVNTLPISATTDYLDTPGNLTTTSYAYTVRPVIGGVETPDLWANPLGVPFSLPADPPTRRYVPVPLQATPDGALDVKFCWVGDLDGDGEFDFVVDRQSGEGARQFLEAYTRNGSLLWRIDLGANSFYKYNIEPGSSSISIGHGDNVTVYDMDGDGKAEVLLRTANGVVFGNGVVASGGATNNVQFISVLDGMTGAEMARATAPNPRLTDGPMNGHMGIAYLDGKRPSLLWAAKNRDSNNDFHGVITAWDWRGGNLTQRWSWVDSGSTHAPEGHQIRIADVDNDGKDEFVDIGYVLDDNGTQLFNIPEIVHGDRFHLTDINPDRPGLENFIIQQNNGSGLATALYDAGTGSMIKKWYAGGVVDVGRGVAGDFDPAVKGCEMFSTQPGIFDCNGNQLYDNHPFPPEAIWWDGDLVREFVSTIGSSATSPGIDKLNTANGSSTRVISLYSDTAAPNSPYNNYIAYGGRPQFWGDILGDWREEMLCVATDNSELRIYSARSTDSAKFGGGMAFRIPTLMHNPQYRCQATTKGYVQANYVDYYLGTDMTPPPPAPMADVDLVWRGGSGSSTWDNGITNSWNEDGITAPFVAGKSVLFDISANSNTSVVLEGVLQPGALTCYSPQNHFLDGTTGSLAGAMPLVKAGAGALTLTGDHPFNGATTVWDGALVVEGSLQNSPVSVWGGTWGGALSAGLKGGRVAGHGQFSQPVSLKYRGAITPGNGMGDAGTLHFGAGLTCDDGSAWVLDLSNNSADPASSDRIAITGNLATSGKVGVVIKSLSGTIPAGSYTLATYSGSFIGNVSNFAVTVPPGTPYTLAVGAGAVTLNVPVTRAATAISWRGTGTIWDLAQQLSWSNGGNADLFVAGDAVTFDGTGAASPIVTLTGALPVASVTVNSSSDYVFTGNGSIHGSGGLTKSGSGMLTILTSNNYTGPTLITGGVLAVSTLADGGIPSSIGAASVGASNLVINGGTLRLTGTQTNTNRSMTLGAAGGTLDIASGGSSMQISGTVTGNGRLTKTGNGTLILAKSNTYSGGTSINGGTIYLAGTTANVSGTGTGSITFNNGRLTMANVQASETAAWNMIVPANMTGRLDADGRCSLTGSLTGSGTFDYYSPYVRSDMKGNWSAFTGQINLATDSDGSEMRVTNSFGFGTAALHLGAESFVYYNVGSSSPTLDIGELTGDATTGIGGGPTAGRTVTWRVGGRNTDATFAGAIVNATGSTAVTKSGSGIWTLAGASSHNGATTIAAGTLRVTGSTNGSNVTVQSNAALGGSGSITGNLTFQNGGILEHSTPEAIPLTITGNLSFGTTTVVKPILGITPVAGTYTLLTYTGTLSGNPSFSWQPAAASNLVASFSTATAGSIIMTLAVDPGSEPDNLVWTGSSNGSWDTTSTNWTLIGTTATYSQGDAVRFDDSGTITTVSSAAPHTPALIVFENSSKNYGLSATAGLFTGPVAITKSGLGRVTLYSPSSHSGATVINGGILSLGNDSATVDGQRQSGGATGGGAATTSLGSGPILVNSGGQIRFGGRGGGTVYTFISANEITLNNGTLVSQDGVQKLTGGVTIAPGGAIFITAWSGKNLWLNSALSGSGPLTIDDVAANAGDTGRAVVRIDSAGNSYNGIITIRGATTGYQGGRLQLENDTALSAATIQHHNTSVPGLLFTTANPQLGALGGSGSLTLPSGTLTTGGNAASTSFTGILSGTGGVVKTGAGSFTLGGANTYTGPTAVNAGKLIVTESLANTTTTVASSGTLGGSGSIAGAVTCHGTLAPGTAVGTLTLSSGLTLSPTSMLDYELGNVSDRVNVTGDLTLAGTLQVTASAGFTAGTYTLLTYTGALTDEDGLILGSLPDGYEATVSTSTAGQINLVVTTIPTPFEQWQIDHFGSTTAAEAAALADPDGDETLNEIEFRLGLNPKDGSSAFRATGHLDPSGFVLAWPSAAGLVFEVRRSPSLDGPWDLLETLAPETPGPASYTDTSPPESKAFYRIFLQP